VISDTNPTPTPVEHLPELLPIGQLCGILDEEIAKHNGIAMP
jgi:hypothetical protein